MNKRSPIVILAFFGIMLSLFGTYGCGGGDTPESLEAAAEVLYQEGERSFKVGKNKLAFPIFDRIAREYPETKVAAKLKEELTLRGLQFGSISESLTIVKMYEVENILVELFVETGEFPSVLETGLDAWGNRIKYKLFPMKKVDFDFMVISAGLDQKYDTGDDIRLVHARSKTMAAVKKGGKPGDVSSAGAAMSAEAAARGVGAGGDQDEKELGLEDLGSLTDDKKGGKAEEQEQEIDLDTLLEDKL